LHGRGDQLIRPRTTLRPAKQVISGLQCAGWRESLP
jgi:hypothetical protein